MTLLTVNCVLNAVRSDLKGSDDLYGIMAADVSFQSIKIFYPVFHIGITKLMWLL